MSRRNRCSFRANRPSNIPPILRAGESIDDAFERVTAEATEVPQLPPHEDDTNMSNELTREKFVDLFSEDHTDLFDAATAHRQQEQANLPPYAPNENGEWD